MQYIKVPSLTTGVESMKYLLTWENEGTRTLTNALCCCFVAATCTGWKRKLWNYSLEGGLLFVFRDARARPEDGQLQISSQIGSGVNQRSPTPRAVSLLLCAVGCGCCRVLMLSFISGQLFYHGEPMSLFLTASLVMSGFTSCCATIIN